MNLQKETPKTERIYEILSELHNKAIAGHDTKDAYKVFWYEEFKATTPIFFPFPTTREFFLQLSKDFDKTINKLKSEKAVNKMAEQLAKEFQKNSSGAAASERNFKARKLFGLIMTTLVVILQAFIVIALLVWLN